MTALQECRACRFWRKRTDSAVGNNSWGDCLRFPPAVVSGRLNEAWPNVRASSWCGEYKPIVVEGAEG